jgi:nitrogen fixation protein FixH
MALVVAVNAVMVAAAFGTWSGLAVQKPYERGLDYNRALAAAERQEALGWTVEARLEASPTGSLVVVEAVDREHRPMNFLVMEIELERPLGAPDRHKAALSRAADGRYVAALPLLAPGQWQARIAASRGGDTVLLSRRLTAP